MSASSLGDAGCRFARYVRKIGKQMSELVAWKHGNNSADSEGLPGSLYCSTCTVTRLSKTTRCIIKDQIRFYWLLMWLDWFDYAILNSCRFFSEFPHDIIVQLLSFLGLFLIPCFLKIRWFEKAWGKQTTKGHQCCEEIQRKNVVVQETTGTLCVQHYKVSVFRLA